MKTRYHYITVALLFTAVAATTYSGVVLTTFTATSEGGTVIVRWQALAESEQSVDRYYLERKRPFDQTFEVIKRDFPVERFGALYEYRDQDLYKLESNEVVYRLRVRLKDGTNMPLQQEARVDYTSTAVRRTWGSIKAMFQ